MLRPRRGLSQPLQRCTCVGSAVGLLTPGKLMNRCFVEEKVQRVPPWKHEAWEGPFPTHLLSLSPGADPTHNNHRLLIAQSPVPSRATAQRPGGGRCPAATLPSWGALTTVRQRQQGPPPGGICGPVWVKGQEPEPKGGADRGASVPLSNIKPAGSTASIQHSINLSMAQGGPNISLPSTHGFHHLQKPTSTAFTAKKRKIAVAAI